MIKILSIFLFSPAVGQFAENQRISAIRKIYQRGISTPMASIEQLWNDYCAYEKVLIYLNNFLSFFRELIKHLQKN